MMSWRAAMALAICLVGQFAMAAPAAGAGWPLCESAEVLLPFSATYTRPDGTTSTHSGVDLPAPVGASVLCVEAGTLTFAGPVPSANGGTVLAATVESATGERWSFMPLSSIEVEEGAWVGEGEPLGVLAETARHVFQGIEPASLAMIGVSALALAANVACLLLISRHRHAGVHMTASYIFSANDVIANLGVIAAGLLVSWTGSPWPDWIIGTVIGLVVLMGAVRILRLR